MKLIDDLFTILDNDAVNNRIKIRINANHDVFKAHFPGNPIVPGVLQIQMITDLLEARFKRHLYMNEIRNIKFITVLIPNSEEELSFQLNKLEKYESGVKATVQIVASDKLYSKISLSFQFDCL